MTLDEIREWLCVDGRHWCVRCKRPVSRITILDRVVAHGTRIVARCHKRRAEYTVEDHWVEDHGPRTLLHWFSPDGPSPTEALDRSVRRAQRALLADLSDTKDSP